MTTAARPPCATELGLLRSIAEEPEQEYLRLIYSDWLEDHGDPERAEFIRLSISQQFSELRPTAEGRPTWRRDALLANNATRWWPEFSWVSQYDDWILRPDAALTSVAGLVCRGTIEGVVCTSTTWVQRRLDLLRAYPLLRVRLVDKYPMNTVAPGTTVSWSFEPAANGGLSDMPNLITEELVGTLGTDWAAEGWTRLAMGMGLGQSPYRPYYYRWFANAHLAAAWLSDRLVGHARRLLCDT